MPAIARFLLPPKGLASCIAAAIYRDTRTADLSDLERMNFFPATPLVTVTLVLQGQLRMARGAYQLADLRGMPPLARISIAMPSDQPTVSWAPHTVVAMTLAIYPDAWARMCENHDASDVPRPLRDAVLRFGLDADPKIAFGELCDDLLPFWNQIRSASGWTGSDKISDWVRHALAKSAAAQNGRSTRSLQRTLRNLTGRSRRSLEFYANLEALHRVRQADPNAELAQTAMEAGYADQSHMGRSVKRATGFSPAALNNRIATDEAFWCYRLLGERF